MVLSWNMQVLRSYRRFWSSFSCASCLYISSPYTTTGIPGCWSVFLPGEMGSKAKECGGHFPAKGGFGLWSHYRGFQKRFVMGCTNTCVIEKSDCMISWVLIELLLLVGGFDTRNILERNKIANSVHAYVCSLRLVVDDELACVVRHAGQ